MINKGAADQWPVTWLESIDSTSEYAKRELRKRGVDNKSIWIAAHQQTAGRGRLGRDWQSPRGNLYTSAIYPEMGGIAHAGQLPFVAALAVHDTIAKYAPEAPAKLKWPNDVRIDGAKISGILIESLTISEEIWVIVGIGVNVIANPQNTGQASTSLADLTRNVPNLTAVFETLRKRFAIRYSQMKLDFAGLLRDWEARAESLGEKITVKQGDELIEGIHAGLAVDGALKLKLDNGAMHIIRSGDVQLAPHLG